MVFWHLLCCKLSAASDKCHSEGDGMIALLHGELFDVTDTSAIVECAGVGYEALMTQPDLMRLPQAGETVTIFTYMNVNENTGVSLFGFLEKDELKMFRLLITVSGVGPKVALAILSTLPANELRIAICGDNPKAIAKAPGVGSKLASKVILELHDKISPEELMQIAETSEGRRPVDNAEIDEAIAGLTALGYSKKDAENAAGKAYREGMTAEQILNGAFRYL